MIVLFHFTDRRLCCLSEETVGFANSLGDSSDYGDFHSWPKYIFHYGMAVNLWESGAETSGFESEVCFSIGLCCEILVWGTV